MERKEYNGWTNYETWSVALLIDNEPGGSDHYREIAADILKDQIGCDSPEPLADTVATLADMLKEDHESAWETILDSTDHARINLRNGIFDQLLTGALSEVDWHEIATHYCEDLAVWTAGSNMPGYMPDEPPARFTDHDDAISYLVDEIKVHADSLCEDPIPVSSGVALEIDLKAGEAITEVEASKGEVTVMFGGRAYFIGRL